MYLVQSILNQLNYLTTYPLLWRKTSIQFELCHREKRNTIYKHEKLLLATQVFHLILHLLISIFTMLFILI